MEKGKVELDWVNILPAILIFLLPGVGASSGSNAGVRLNYFYLQKRS